LNPQRIATPQQGEQNQHNSEIFGKMRDNAVIVKKPCHAEQNIPIMKIRRLLTGDAADEHKLPGPRVIYIGCKIDETLACPPKRDRRAEGLSSHEKSDETDSGDDDLQETSTQDLKKTSKERKENMPCFMERKIDEVQKRFSGIIARDRFKNKYQSQD